MSHDAYIIVVTSVKSHAQYLKSQYIFPKFVFNKYVFSPLTQEAQEVELHMDEEQTSVDSAEEMRAGSSSSAEIEKDEAIAKVQAYMNQALMDNDVSSDTDSSEDEDREPPRPPRVDGESSTGSTEPLVSNYTITNL